MKKLMILATALVFAAIGCQTKTSKGPKPAPVAETMEPADTAPEVDAWHATPSEESEEPSVAEVPEEEPQPSYDDDTGGDYGDDDSYEPAPDDSGLDSYDASEG